MEEGQFAIRVNINFVSLRYSIGLNRPFLLLITDIFTISDLLLNIWMLSRYEYFSNLTLTYFILMFYIGIYVFKIRQTEPDISTIFSKTMCLMYETCFKLFLVNFLLNFVEFIYNFANYHIATVYDLKIEFINIFQNNTSTYLFIFIYFSYLIILLINYFLVKEQVESNETTNKPRMMFFNNIFFILVVLTIIFYSFLFSSYNFLVRKIIFIIIYIFLGFLFLRILLKKYSNNLISKRNSLFLITVRLILILVFLNQIGCDYLFYKLNEGGFRMN